MRFAAYLGFFLALVVALAGCNGNAPARGRAGALDPRSTTNRLVVHVDEERKISVRESGAILWARGTQARIDESGRVTDRQGKLLAWLHNDNIRIRGGGSIPIRTGLQGEVFLSHQAQRDASLKVLEARVAKDGSIVPGEGRVATMRMEGESSLTNRRLALLLLLLLHNDLLASPPQPGDSSQPETEDDMRIGGPDSQP